MELLIASLVFSYLIYKILKLKLCIMAAKIAVDDVLRENTTLKNTIRTISKQ